MQQTPKHTILPVDYPKYIWRESKDDKGYFIREAAGCEAISGLLNRFVDGEGNIYLGVSVSFKASVPTIDVFLSLIRSAWVTLRFSVPTVAAHKEHDSQGSPLITYRVANSHEDALQWARRTVRLRETSASLDGLRFELSKSPIPEVNKDQTFLYVVPRSQTSTDFLLCTSHVPFDGAGIKIVFSKFLETLSEYISSPSLATSQIFAWGTEGKNLLPAITEILAPGEDCKGPRYIQTLDTPLQTWKLASSIPVCRLHRGHAGTFVPTSMISVQRECGTNKCNFIPGLTLRASRCLSLEDSLKFCEVARSLGFTVNHLSKPF
jgi:hypothetical protein